MKHIVDGFKKVQAVAVFEVAIGMIAGILFLRLLSVIFGRQSLGTVWGAEDSNAEDLENLGGRGKARRAGRQAARGERKTTRQHNRQVMTKTAIAEGKKRGRAGRMDDYQPEPEQEPEEPEALPSDEDYAEALEMAEYFESLTQEDLDNMDDAEYEEYAEYMEMAQNAE
jgi:hypothetical protein